MLLRLAKAIKPRALSATPKATPGVRNPEIDPVGVEIPLQVIFYNDQNNPQIYDGTALMRPEGTTSISIPNVPPPPAGTTVQIVVYHPGDPAPTIVEGITTDQVDGIINILFADPSTQL